MIETVGVIGAGTMGNGIAQVCAQAGLKLIMLDISEAALARGMETVRGSLERLVKKEKITPLERDKALARITTTTESTSFANCDLVVEAANEKEELKVNILREICSILNERAIVATNTSSISITKLASTTERADRFIGMHFFNPVPVMALLVLIRGLQTSDETHARVRYADRKDRDHQQE